MSPILDYLVMWLGEISKACANQVIGVGLHNWWAWSSLEEYYGVRLGLLSIFHHQDQFRTV